MKKKKNREFYNAISKKLIEYRHMRHLSLTQLSNKLLLLGCDIPRESLYEIEHNHRFVKDYELAALAKVLEVPVQDFLNDYINELDK